MASSSEDAAAVSASESESAELPAVPAAKENIIKKTIVFSPIDIKKIGLDKLIKVNASPPAKLKDDEMKSDEVKEEEVEVKEEEVAAKDVKDEPVSPKIQNMFCKNLKLKMQKVLQDKKITIAAKKKEPELVIVKKPSVVDGRKIKVMQNQVIVARKSTEDQSNAINGNTTLVVKTSPSPTVAKKQVVKKAAVYEFDEGSSPVFKASPMRTYKRKRSEGEETPPPVKIATRTPTPAKKMHEKFPVEIPKKRGRQRKVELVASETDEEEDDIEITLINDDENDDSEDEDSEDPEDPEDSETEVEEIIIVRVPEKEKEDDDDEEDDEEIHFITDSEKKRVDEATKPVNLKRPGRKSMAEIIQAIKKKRGRRSKSDLELLAKWDKETKVAKAKAKSDDTDDEEDDEEEERSSDEDDQEEVEKIIMSPTRTGRVPKRNKLFDNFVTGSKLPRKYSSDAEEPKEKTPKTVQSSSSSTSGPKRGRGRPRKSKPVEPQTKVDIVKKEIKEEAVDEAGEAVHVTGDAEVIVIPKKRGRPAIKKVEVQQVERLNREDVVELDKEDKEDEDEDEDDKKVVVKRPRGRPPKFPKKVETTKNKGESNEDTSQEADSKDCKEEECTEVGTENKTIVESVGNDSKEEQDGEKEDDEKEELTSLVKNGTDPDPEVIRKEKDENTEEAADCDRIETKLDKDKEKQTIVGDEVKKEKKEIEEESECVETEVHRKDGSPKMAADEPKVKRGRKRTLEREESPSTSAADGVDEPSKRRKVDTCNVPVADVVATPKEESANKKMYRILVANLVLNIRERMAAAQDHPKGPGQSITCAICKINCKKYEWSLHKLRWHNNLAWKTTEEPLDLDNPIVVNSVLVQQYPQKPYICDYCGDSKKSALGFLTHKAQCNLSRERVRSMCVTCNICSKIILPYLLVEHEKSHRKEARQIERDRDNIEQHNTIPAIEPEPEPEPLPSIQSNQTDVTQKGEGIYTKTNRLLVANLAFNIRQRMADAQEKPKLPGQSVTCAVCRVHCKPVEWSAHKLRWHNNVAWKTTEAPLDLDNYLIIQAELLLQYPAKPYLCDYCNDSKKSSLAFLTHKVYCNQTNERLESLRVPCELCQKMLLPHHLVEHAKAHKKQTLINKSKRLSLERAQEADAHDSSQKRAAAKRASLRIQEVTEELSIDVTPIISYKLLKQFFHKNHFDSGAVKALLKKFLERGEIDCPFRCGLQFNKLATIYDHFESCQLKPHIFYVCKLCLSVFETIADIRKHVSRRHTEEVQKANEGDSFHADADPEGDEEEECELRNRYCVEGHVNAFWKPYKFKMVSKLSKPPESINMRPVGVNMRIYCKMLDFCIAQYSQQLYSTYAFKKATWFAVNKNYISHYLPKMKLSIPIGYKRPGNKATDQSFKRYKLFEATLVNDTANIYCGGPITAMAWAPTDYNQLECEQMLCVAVQKDFDKRFSYKRNYAHKNMIQLWNFGVLINTRSFTKPPELELAIAHQYGEVLSMEWCPSGCYEVTGSDTRLGLLAICTTDGNVYCYSVGRSGLLSDKLVKTKPVFKLVANKECDIDLKLGFRDFYPTQLSWTKAAGHKFIAVAYSNGLVGMFNLQTESAMLQDVDSNNIQVFYPYLSFKADRMEITAISLHHLDGGNRCLVTGSGTRMLLFWDLHASTLRPSVLSKRSCSRKVYWPVNALTTIACSDDCSSNGFLQLSTNTLVKIDFVRPSAIIFAHAAARAVDGSDWGGIIHLANEAGEVTCATYRDLYPFTAEVPCKPYICSNASVVCDEDAELSLADRHKYHIIQKTHKLLFHDYKLDTNVKRQERPKHSLSCPDFKKFPLQAATVACTNSNRFSFLFNAVGYNIGLVRVFHSNFLNSSRNTERYNFNI